MCIRDSPNPRDAAGCATSNRPGLRISWVLRDWLRRDIAGEMVRLKQLLEA